MPVEEEEAHAVDSSTKKGVIVILDGVEFVWFDPLGRPFHPSLLGGDFFC